MCVCVSFIDVLTHLFIHLHVQISIYIYTHVRISMHIILWLLLLLLLYMHTIRIIMVTVPWGKLTSTWKSRSFPEKMIWQLWMFMDFPSDKAIQEAPNPGIPVHSLVTGPKTVPLGNPEPWRLGDLQTMGTTGTNWNAPNHGGHLFWSSFLMMPLKVQKETKPAWFCSCGRRSKDCKVQTTFGTQPYNIPFRETQWLDESSYFLLGWCFFSPVAAIGITILNTHETTNNVHPLAYPVTLIQYPMFELENVPLLMAGRLVVSTSIAGWYSPHA